MEKFFEVLALLPGVNQTDVEATFRRSGLSGVIVSIFPPTKDLGKRCVNNSFKLRGCNRFKQYLTQNGAEIAQSYPEGYQFLGEIAMRSIYMDLLDSFWSDYFSDSNFFGDIDYQCYCSNALRLLENKMTRDIALTIIQNSTSSGEPLNKLCWNYKSDTPPQLTEVRDFCRQVLQQALDKTRGSEHRTIRRAIRKAS